MNNRWTLALMVVALTSTATAQAAMKDWLPEPTIKTDGLKTIYAGVGLSSDLLHVNAELPTQYGTAYAKVGSFWGGSNDVAGLVGFRAPYHLTGTDQNGYYLGAFAGHIESSSIDSKDYNRLGVGVDLSYVWLNSKRLSAASIGIAIGERKTSASGGENKPQPKVLFSYTFNMGVY